MENLHPEYAAVVALVINIIVHVCEAHGIQVPADTQSALTLVGMWLAIRITRRLAPPATVDLQKQIQKNIEEGK